MEKQNYTRIIVKIHQISYILLATVVEGDLKTLFSMATTPRCRGGRYLFPWIAPLYVTYIAEC